MPSRSRLPMTRNLIERKLSLPRLADRVVKRERVESLIQRAVAQDALLTVTGAAGSGKSTAIAAALRDSGRPVAWISLDSSERAAGRLLLYLEAGVSRHAPEAEGVATDALAAGLPVAEAAGLLAESLHGSNIVLVCDNVERISRSRTAIAALTALARYVPAGVALVLVSRERLPLPLNATDVPTMVDISDDQLAFTVDEAERALRAAGLDHVDPAEAVRRAGGWVTGVLFEDPAALGQQSDRMYDYLSAQVLGELPDDERDLLVCTSLLPEVTRSDATQLGVLNVGRLMAALRRRYLPITWSAPDAFAVAPLFRDHLLARLEELDSAQLKGLRERYAQLLVGKGEAEEAVDVLLSMGEVEEAWRLARALLPTLVNRMDLESAARWLDAFPMASVEPTAPVAAAVLRVAIGLEQPLRGVELLDRSRPEWVRTVSGVSDDDYDEILVLLTWSVWHVRGLAAAEDIAALIGPGRGRQIVDALLSLSRGTGPNGFPEFATTPLGPLEGLLMRIAYTRGRLAGLSDPGVHGPWRSAVGAPWVVAALRATGQIERAMDLYKVHEGGRSLWLNGLDAADLMVDLGRPHDAWAAVRAGWQLQHANGSTLYAALLGIAEARLHLKLDDDPQAALRALAEARAAGAEEHSFTRELENMWRGVCHLRLNEYDAAHTLLAQAVASMQRTDHRLHLATAATYLAEASWQAGAEEAADKAAHLALVTADQVGSTHLLLAALEDVPGVAVRGADTEQYRDARWHELISLLSRRRGALTVTTPSPRLVLEEFGEPSLLLDGCDVTPRLRKSTELMARLLAAPDRRVPRQELLSGLFRSRSEPAARSYLRQAVYRLREILPETLVPAMSGEDLVISGPELVVGTSSEVLDTIDLAARQPAETQFATLVEATARADRGAFLSGFAGVWVESRRAELDDRLRRARLDLARVAYRLGRYWEADLALDTVLREDPYREEAWLLRIAVAHASGNDDGVLATYQRYLGVMRDLGVPPSAEVHRQVTRVRS
jgi:DNA-binding SARP family transcriptional activator